MPRSKTDIFPPFFDYKMITSCFDYTLITCIFCYFWALCPTT